MMSLARLFLLVTLTSAAALAAPREAASQAPVLIKSQAGSPLSDRFKVDSSGAFVSYGFVRDVGNTTGCAAQLPASGAGTRFEWHPCRGSVRFGRVSLSQPNSWNDDHMDDFTFAGGNQVEASGYGGFAFGDQVTVSSTVGVGFGSAVTVSGTAGFSAGASNVCSGFACTAIGYTVRAGGQGSVALGYRATANNDNSVTIGYRGSNNGHIGSIVLAGVVNPASQTDSVRAQADGEFRLRAPGGIILRTSFASNSAAGVGGNTGCDLPAGSGTFSCSSSRFIKANFRAVSGEDVLSRIRALPITTWNYKDEGKDVRHMGPVAQDWWKAFQLGTGQTAIGVTDMSGVTLAATKALDARTISLQSQLKAKDAEIATLKKNQSDLEARLTRLEALLKKK
jgi:hypothetical protein